MPVSPYTSIDLFQNAKWVASDTPVPSENAETAAKPPAVTEAPSFTFARAVELMKSHSPGLKELRAEFEHWLRRVSKRRCRIRLLRPDPSLGLGPTSVANTNSSPLGHWDSQSPRESD